MIHVISKLDVDKIRHAAASADPRCLGVPEMSSSEWDFDKDYQTAWLWARFCIDHVLPKEVRHIVLGWRNKDGSQTLLRCPEVYSEAGFKDFTCFASRQRFMTVYAVHARD